MSRLRPIDRVLLFVVTPIWLLAFSLGVRAAWLDTGISPVMVAAPATPDDYPTASAFRSYFDVGATELRLGDRILRVGNIDLRGVGPIRYLAITSEESEPGGKPLAIRYEQDGREHEMLLPVVSHRTFSPLLPASLTFALAAIVGLFVMRPTPMVRAAIPAFFCLALEFCTIAMLSGYWEVMIGWPLRVAVGSLTFPLALRVALRFPQDEVPTGSFARWGPWLFLPRGFLDTSPLFNWPVSVTTGTLLGGLVGLVFVVAILAILTRNYIGADALGRRQLKWILLGLYVASIPTSFVLALQAYDPYFISWMFDAGAAYAIIPFFILIAVVRNNLFDVERLLSATASYNVLLFVALGGSFVFGPMLGQAVSEISGLDPTGGQILFSLAFAAIVLPAQRKLRPAIESVFFKERHAVDTGFDKLLDRIRRCEDAQDLTQQVGEGLVHLFRPEALAIYTPLENALAPVFAHGHAVPTRLEGQGPLMETLKGRSQPLAFGDSGRGNEAAALGPFDRAVLETLGTAVVLPIQGVNGLAAVVCLGERQSGDVFSSTDLSLLSALSDLIRSQLARFDQAQVLAQAREMQDALRQYVPGAIAEQIASGGDLSSGEREVSVLFVDIRGYTRISEGRSSAEIFSTVNRYTEAVSRIVAEHGGAVVEFNGDGMMAVFGAPRELPEKERAALDSARAIVVEVSSMREGGEGETLSVGVGIATGEAFVGSIKAADRMIWSAIGNTTNLAARLQSMTREIDASVMIDAATRNGAGNAAADMDSLEGLKIRGRREPVDVYSLPL